jgi:hypothetical protein
MMDNMTRTPASELIARTPEYPKTRDMDAYKAYQEQIIAQVELPPFYVLPPAVPVYTITVHPDDTELYSLVVTDDANNVVETPDPYDVEDTFDYIQDELKADVVFAGDIHLIPGNGSDDGTASLHQMAGNTLVTVPIQHDLEGNVRILSSLTTAQQHYYAKEYYLQWLHQATRYEANPSDFVTAYSWVIHHPAFWQDGDLGHSIWNEPRRENLRLYVNIDDDTNNPYIVIHVYVTDPNNRSTTIHDSKLNGHGTTYEEALLEVAAKLYHQYSIDGLSKS